MHDLWDIIAIPIQKIDTVCAETMKLRSNSRVPLSSLSGWCSGGCNAMPKASRLISEAANRQIYTIHCSMYRIDLCA